MSYVKKLLLPDEQVVFIATLHWIIFVPGLVLTSISGLLGIFSYVIAQSVLGDAWGQPVGRALAGVALIFSLAGFVLLLGAFIRQSATELAITNRRIIAKYGFISRTTFEIMLNRITGVNFDQTIMGRIFGYGTILVHGAGGDVSPFDIVSNPQDFQHALMSVLERGGKG